ncbi:hypothetical protein JCM3765_002814 [Sporobolomyces pararoseus]
MTNASSLPTFLAQFCGSRPTSPTPFGNSTKTTSEPPSHMDYFNSKKTSQLDEQDLLDTIPSSHQRKRDQEEEMNRVTEALNYLSPTDSPARTKRAVGGGAGSGYFGKHHVLQDSSYGSSTTSSSSLSTPSLESDYSSSSLSASCSPLSTPLDYSDEYSTPRDEDDDSTAQPLSASKVPTSLNFGIASRRKIHLPKLEIPPFQLDASYFSKPAPPPRTKPSTFQFDVSPPRRSKTAYSTSLPSNPAPPPQQQQSTNKFTSSSWNPEPVDLAGIIGERPGSPTIKFRQKRRDHGFAF